MRNPSFPYLERGWQRTSTPDSMNPTASRADSRAENSGKGRTIGLLQWTQ